MTNTLELPRELEERLALAAERRGLHVDDYALQILESGTPVEPTPLTGAEVVSCWKKHGLIGMWADRADIVDSSDYARDLRRLAETRIRDYNAG